MNDDLIEQSDMLLKDFNSSGYISKYVMEVLPQLVAEIKRLRTDNEFLHKFVDAPGSTLEAAIAECKRLQEQHATWQKIAIEATAKHNLINALDAREREYLTWENSNPDTKQSFMETAAKELGLQVTREAGYLVRLEKEYMEIYKWINPDLSDQEAQVALEKIREGAGDDR